MGLEGSPDSCRHKPKRPLVHSPGITFAALETAVKGCNRPCEVLVVSKGWQEQLPIRSDARRQFQAKYGNVKLVELNSGDCAACFNDLMDKGISAVLMLHTTC